MSNRKYYSGNYAIATAVGALRQESPLLPELNEVLVFHQDFMQFFDDFFPQDYNTVNPQVLSPAYLTNESDREDMGGGVCKWTRSWASIPSTYGKAGGTYPFKFPGFDGDTGSREPRQLPVAMEITREFFLCGTGGVYSSWQQIPILKGFVPYDINPDDSTDKTATVDSLRDGDGGSDPGTSPSLSDYKAMVAAGSPIQVEDSKVTNWRGGIYMRETFTVVAQ